MLGLLFKPLFLLFKFILLPAIVVYFLLKMAYKNKRKVQNKLNQKKKIAFFHPYCNAGGGGEKVLWCLVYSLLKYVRYIDQFEICIYTGDTESDQAILKKATDRFNIDVLSYQSNIKFIRVSGRKMLEPMRVATMIFQMIGIMIYTLKCLWTYQPDIFFDSTGFAFSYIVAKKMLGCKVICYTHYPFISSDMIDKVTRNEQSFNNKGFIAQSGFFSKLKYLYYIFLTGMYKLMGNYLDMTFTNSTWTDDHIRKLWKPCRKQKSITESAKLYPPCNVESLIQMQKEKNKQEIQMMSFAQFRPEKDHMMQIRVFERVLERLSDEEKQRIKFKIVGSVRHEDDEALLKSLQDEVSKRNLNDKIAFVKNPPFTDILKLFQNSDIGIHTMKDEHFGIAVVEMMAGGLITIAHKSAGPLKDIIQTDKFGFLCENEDDYVKATLNAIQMQPEKRNEMIKNSKQKAESFSEYNFYMKSAAHFEHFLEYYKLV